MALESRMKALLDRIELVAWDLARVNNELWKLAGIAHELAKEESDG